MKQQRSWGTAGLTLVAALLGSCGSDDGQEMETGTGTGTGTAVENATAACLAESQTPPPRAWVCPAPLTLECGSSPPMLYVRESESNRCTSDTLVTTLPEPRAVGVHDVRITRGDRALVCETTLTVTDSMPPRLEPKTLSLWPPNHTLHAISVADCVRVVDACDPDLTGEFIWASSDEPVDGRGDGNHDPDILVDGCDRISVRSERQGPKDGRVYKLGVRVVDRAGHAVESHCTIVVDHDQRGVVGADSGESYRITLDGTRGVPACDGAPPPRTSAPPPGRDAGT